MNNNNNILKSEVENITSNNTHTQANLGLAMPEVDTVAGVTHMVAPGPVDEGSVYHKMDFRDASPQSSLIEYLSRPTYLASGSFTNGSIGPYLLRTKPNDFISSVNQNLTGAYGFRATVCYRVEIAAMPQTQGIVRLCYEYLPYDASSSKISYRPIASQLPGAEVNLRSGSSVEVKIPFVSDRDFWPIVNGTYAKDSTCFNVALFPYGPVTWDTTAVTSPTWTIYRWYEDVELVGKSINTYPVTPQSGRNPEADNTKVSTWFKYASKIAGFASTIPALTTLALPVSWAFDSASKVAAHFGWSKPNDGSYMGVVHRSWARGINTCADLDFAQPMGYYANNEVAVQPGFAGSNVDEMSLCYLTCKPGLIANCKLLTTDTAGQIKWTTPVSPACFVFQNGTGFAQLSAMGLGSTATSGNKPGYFPSPLAYCASFFERWRGNIIFRFKFSSTKFHSGKILIGYVPGEDVYDGTTAGGFSQAPFGDHRYDFHSVIIDLRVTEEYDFVVPFTYPAAWCNTGMLINQAGVFITPNTGSVFVRVIDPLFCPDNVATSVDLLVEVLSDCGLELSQPTKSLMMPLDMSLPQTVIAQSGVDSDGFNAAVHATGERILSVKQIMARPIWVSYPSGTQSQQEPLGNLAYYPITQFTPQAGSYAAPTIISDSILNRIGCMYALVRGSIVFRSFPTLSPDSSSGVTKASAVASYNWAPALSKDISAAAFSVEGDGTTHIHIPYYGKNTRMRTAYNIKPTGSDYDPNSTTRVLYRGWNDGTSSFGATYGIRGVCAGDDLQFGAFTGVPACVTAEPYNTNSNQDTLLTRVY